MLGEFEGNLIMTLYYKFELLLLPVNLNKIIFYTFSQLRCVQFLKYCAFLHDLSV